ncbi:dTDP-4-dehydrorhamnose 3,5-epimerase [Sulfuracidifex tepidarius]|uniref:dTDP-4-dehydrorhamnose 3,5-epimerase n=1 Tax=Sulfuracidifex tepidarius TaxID=1294262 RepID=A0A510DVY8_9CREN|nr:dTDP-4-dehydrorhamnose 3,5-epimerase [Sulfuracidifex tepidarius]BBG24357.1 dTDP-4-dehydrorhamnose 3,5-epimerase [Sulfuracidifex tepidarius]BBG27115.1 dTDP-4-dehydrorhamnose 3,5-epimerase [Sulfuracidifex tepidarius]
MPFEFKKTEIEGVLLVETRKFDDRRGFFVELFKENQMKGIPNFVQGNMSFSVAGVIRGLHYQINPFPQGKLVTVANGRILDVAVDIRRSSPTFGKFVKAELTPGRMLWIPPGFAHGFQAMEDSVVIYFITHSTYSPQHERCINWNDEEIGIDWPLKNWILSDKDALCPKLSSAEINFI